jgi:hypothetical protein
MIRIKYSFHLLVVEGHYKELQVKGAVKASEEVPGQDQCKTLEDHQRYDASGLQGPVRYLMGSRGIARYLAIHVGLFVRLWRCT